MILEVAVSAALAAECPQSASSFGQLVEVPSDPDPAYRLAAAIHPADTTKSFLYRAAIDSLKMATETEPSYQRAERLIPGFGAKVLERAGPTLTRAYDLHVPWLHTCMAEKVERELSAAEINQALTFATSEQGQKAIDQLTRQWVEIYEQRGPLNPEDLDEIDAPSVSISGRLSPAVGKAANSMNEVLDIWRHVIFAIEGEAIQKIIEGVVEEIATQADR